MAHLTAIIDQITRMENSLVNILLETAVKLSTLTDANIFVMVESAGRRKWAGRKSLRDEYVRGMLQPSTKDMEVTEAMSTVPQEEFSMGHLMGMASGGGVNAGVAELPTVPGFGQAVFPTAKQQSSPPSPPDHPVAAKRPRLDHVSVLPPSIVPSSAISSAKVAVNNNVATSPTLLRRKSPNRETPPIEGVPSPNLPSAGSRETKNLKDEFNGDDVDDGDTGGVVVVKEELGRSRVEDRTFDDEDDEAADATLDDGPGGGVTWGEVALAGPSGMQPNADANQPEPERIGIADYMAVRTPEPYVCGFCYVVFESASSLAEHQTTHEAAPIDSSNVPSTPSVPESLLNAPADDNEENGDDGIFVEGYAHPNGKDYLCTICNKPFKRKDYFKQHLLSHSKKFQCPHCNFNFARKDHLGRHLKNRVCLRGLENGEDDLETKAKMLKVVEAASVKLDSLRRASEDSDEESENERDLEDRSLNECNKSVKTRSVVGTKSSTREPVVPARQSNRHRETH